MRRNLAEAAAVISPHQANEDVSVPLDAIPQLVAGIERLGQREPDEHSPFRLRPAHSPLGIDVFLERGQHGDPLAGVDLACGLDPRPEPPRSKVFARDQLGEGAGTEVEWLLVMSITEPLSAIIQ